MKNTQFKVEDVFDNIIGKDNNTQDEIIKLNISLTRRFIYKHKNQFYRN